jgi:putative glutamine amidotransferase
MSNRHPLIGLNTDNYSASGQVDGLRPKYWQALVSAGAIPVLIPQIQDEERLLGVLGHLHGFVMIGGDDLPARRFGQEDLPSAIPMRPERDRSDFCLLDLLLQSPKPTLAICLGCQELNVIRGGSLYRDLFTEGPRSSVRHYEKPSVYLDHEVTVEAGGKTAVALGKDGRVLVNSSHHQAIRDLGRGLTVTARAPDGIIEAVEVEDHPWFVGVQWHPELMTDRPEQARLFNSLVNQAQKFL